MYVINTTKYFELNPNVGMNNDDNVLQPAKAESMMITTEVDKVRLDRASLPAKDDYRIKRNYIFELLHHRHSLLV